MISKESTIVLKLVYVVTWGMQNISKVLGYILLFYALERGYLVLILIGKADFNVATTYYF